MGGGMGAMDLDHWKVTLDDKEQYRRIVGYLYGAKVMKKLVGPGTGTTNPHPPAQVLITYIGRVRDADSNDGDAGLLFDEAHRDAHGLQHGRH